MGSICSTTNSTIVEIHPDDAYHTTEYIIDNINKDLYLKDNQLIRVAAINKCLYDVIKKPVVDIKTKVRPYSEMQVI